MNDLIQPAIGAVAGFLLAQIFNLAVVGYHWLRRPQLVIEGADLGYLLLSHSTDIASGESARENQYGFSVRNAGATIAVGVRFQITKLEVQRPGEDSMFVVADTAFDLFSHSGASSARGSPEVTIVPGAAVLVDLGTWREDYDLLLPSVRGLPEFYSELAEGARDFKLTVVAFAEDGQHVSEAMTIRIPVLSQRF